MHKYLIMSCGLGIVFFLMYASYGYAFYFGASLVRDGLCTPGSIFTVLELVKDWLREFAVQYNIDIYKFFCNDSKVFFSVMAGAFSIGNALPFINSVSTAVGAASVIFDIIARKPRIDPYSNRGLKPHSVSGYIELQNVSFKYPARPDIKVSFIYTLRANEVLLMSHFWVKCSRIRLELDGMENKRS